MAMASWDPFREMEMLRREVDRVFENLGGRNYWSAPFSRFSFLPGRSARAYPLINLSEDADNLYVEALAPGINPESLKVTVVRDQLTLSGEKTSPAKGAESESFHRNERAAGKFIRTITLPVEVDEGKIKAEYKNGLLLIAMPKAEAAKPKQITVNVG
jgi:HSP20 family protein